MQNGRLSGYGLIRKRRAGYKIGPLFADNPEFAEKLFLALTSHVKAKEPFYFDIPKVNRDAVNLAERYNMAPVFETARMYTHKKPDLPISRIYGVTSFELG